MKTYAALLALLTLGPIEGGPDVTSTNWGFLEGAESPGAMHEYTETNFGYLPNLTPVFDLNPESTGSIDTSLDGYAFTRATTATTFALSGSDYVASTTSSGTPRYVKHPTGS